MIKTLRVVNLNRRLTFGLEFHRDINIITGRNGSGKTTVLKLLWYAISGNLERILPEIPFDSFILEADNVVVKMEVDRSPSEPIARLTYTVDGTERQTERPVSSADHWSGLNDANRQVAQATGSSVFFPTFRRIEGGFSTRAFPGRLPVPAQGDLVFFAPDESFDSREGSKLRQAVTFLSTRLSVLSHHFVASISTDDIVSLLTTKYAEVSERLNSLHKELSTHILRSVGDDPTRDPELVQPDAAVELLREIRRQARAVVVQSDVIQRPFTVLSDLIKEVFHDKGIKLGGPLTLGNAREAIESNVLSAGEKQMLGFLCYNAFAARSCLLIDEPEISLHVDWQRSLFGLLLQQSTSNQFIVATHSPFIYAKFADRELSLNADRGDQNAAAVPD